MKLPCSLIRDLLPLYGEGHCSPETADAVREQLAACPECREALKALQTPAPLPPEENQRKANKLSASCLWRACVFAVDIKYRY